VDNWWKMMGKLGKIRKSKQTESLRVQKVQKIRTRLLLFCYLKRIFSQTFPMDFWAQWPHLSIGHCATCGSLLWLPGLRKFSKSLNVRDSWAFDKIVPTIKMNSVLLIGWVEMLWHHVWDNGSNMQKAAQTRAAGKGLWILLKLHRKCDVWVMPKTGRSPNIQTGSWSIASEAPILRSSTQHHPTIKNHPSLSIEVSAMYFKDAEQCLKLIFWLYLNVSCLEVWQLCLATHQMRSGIIIFLDRFFKLKATTSVVGCSWLFNYHRTFDMWFLNPLLVKANWTIKSTPIPSHYAGCLAHRVSYSCIFWSISHCIFFLYAIYFILLHNHNISQPH